VQKLLSAHLLDFLLINIKVFPISCAYTNKFEYSMDDGVTKLMLETQNNTLSMYTKCI